MSSPLPEYRPVLDPDRAGLERSPDQVAHEDAMREVEETLLNVEHAIRRAERAHRAVAARGSERNAELAVGDALEHLQAVHKKLFQDAYFAGDQQCLI